ncbi:MAG: M56 family metallopeptidase, partial [Planctomycetota bacterium]
MINEILFENSFLWNCLWQSTLCIGAGLLVSFIYKGRASRGHRVLFLAMAAAVLVPVISALVRHYELGIFVTEQAPIQTEIKDMSRITSYNMPEFVPAGNVEYTPSTTATTAPPAAVSQPQGIKIPWRSIVIWGWTILSFILLVRLLVTFVLGICLLGRAESLNCQEIQAAASIARAKLGISKSIEVYKSSEIRSPVIWCWSSEPTLLVPSNAESSSEAIDWVSVLCHELAHWKRRDHISGLLAEVMVCVFPWNPLMWWAKRRMVSLSEQACDDWVLASGQLDTNYAQSLLDLAPQGRMAFVPAVVGSKKTLVERIRRILKGQCDKPKTGTLWILTVSTAVICMALGIALAQTRQVKTETDGGQRVLHFPKDRSLGRIMIQDASLERHIDTFFYWIDNANWYEQAEYLGEAKGEIAIPKGKRAALFVNKDAWKDLSPLSELEADDLYMLKITESMEGPVKADDRCMRHIAGLTGLKVLDLHWTNISSKGLQYIKNFKNLERLYLPERITNSGLADVAELKSLKGLYFKKNRVTNIGLAHLAKLSSLEELELAGEQIDDRGLVYLSKLPNLRYLLLAGENFGDDGMVNIKDVPSLRILHLGHLPQLTDAGVANLSAPTGLENLSFHWNQNITDEGLSHLKEIKSLKKLDVGNATITDAGLTHLSDMKSLEHLELLPHGITDKGLIHLSELSKLKYLKVGCSSPGSPITDAGLQVLSGLKDLEELMIGGEGITDAGLAQIARLSKLNYLLLCGCPQVTSRGMAELTTLKSLKTLYIYDTKLTVSGLSQFNAMSGLVVLNASLARDDSVLDISGMTNLEQLSLDLGHDTDEYWTDADLACLANLSNLKWLQIHPRKLSDAGLAHLRGLTNIERLGIGGGELTDDGLLHLANMNKLNHLTISDGAFGSGGNLTDKALHNLGGLKSLNYLNIACENNTFSRSAIEQLKRNLPNLNYLKTGEMGRGMGGGMMGGRGSGQSREVKATEASVSTEVETNEDLQATGRGIGGGMGGGMMGGMGGVTESDTDLPLIEESRFDNAQSTQTQIAVESWFLTVDGKFLEDIGLSKDVFDKPANSRESKIIDDLTTTFILRATQSLEKTKILAAPKLTVLDGESATLSTVNERHYISGYTPAADTDGEPEAKQDSEVIGITIALKPRLLEDDKIFMDIDM